MHCVCMLGYMGFPYRHDDNVRCGMRYGVETCGGWCLVCLVCGSNKTKSVSEIIQFTRRRDTRKHQPATNHLI